MSNPVTVLAPIKLMAGKTEADLLAASREFQEGFVSQQAGVIRRELVRTAEGEYMDIIQFRSKEDAEQVIEAERLSPHCATFFSVMDLSGVDMDADMPFYASLETHG